jgi:pimeloyl-ACP methyl ester carboxylesterase
MADFVLVPGAWLGAWAWDEVAERLRADGHEVVAVTLTGLAELHQPDSAQTPQAQHVADIVDATRGLSDVVLVGHSYSGIPTGQAAALLGDKLRRIVYLDSNIPIDGQSFADGWSPEGRAWLAGQLAESGGFWPPLTAEDYAGQDLTDDQIATIVKRSTPHPGRSLTEPAALSRPITGLPTTYVKCLMDGPTPSNPVLQHLESPSWTLTELNTGHWSMFSQPDELAALLISVS